MEDWYRNFFLTHTEKYCRLNNIDFKILLIIDNAPSHPDLSEICPNVKVIFLPPNTTSLLQPMDMGVISIAKTHFKYEMLECAMRKAEGPQKITLLQFLKSLTILDAIKFFGRAWANVPKSAMINVWKKLLSEDHQSTTTPESLQESRINEIITLGNKLGMENLDIDVVKESIAYEEDTLTIEELIELGSDEVPDKTQDQNSCEIIEVEKKALSSKDIKKALELINQARDILNETDPDQERVIAFNQNITAGCSIYKDLLKEKEKKRKQSNMDDFFSEK